MTQPSLFDQTARMAFIAALRDGQVMDCPCCGRYSQLYRRKITATMARVLIALYRSGGANDFVHYKVFARIGEGDFPVTRYWGLCIPKDHAPDKKKAAGQWMLTHKGVQYVNGLLSVSEVALVFNNQVYGFDGDPKSIKDALGKKFSYRELMGE